MLGHVYVVEDARDLAQIVRDVTRYGGAYRPEVCHFLLFHRQPTQTDFKLRISTSLFSDGQIGRKSRRRWIKRCIISVLKRIAWSAKLIFSCPCGEEFEFTCHLLVSYFQELRSVVWIRLHSQTFLPSTKSRSRYCAFRDVPRTSTVPGNIATPSNSLRSLLHRFSFH